MLLIYKCAIFNNFGVKLGAQLAYMRSSLMKYVKVNGLSNSDPSEIFKGRITWLMLNPRQSLFSQVSRYSGLLIEQD